MRGKAISRVQAGCRPKHRIEPDQGAMTYARQPEIKINPNLRILP